MMFDAVQKKQAALELHISEQDSALASQSTELKAAATHARGLNAEKEEISLKLIKVSRVIIRIPIMIVIIIVAIFVVIAVVYFVCWYHIN